MATNEKNPSIAAPVASPDPVAIIGISLRFPGALCDEAGLWSALRDARDLVTQVDPRRWATQRLQHPRRSEPGRSITFAAGVLDAIDSFDAGFFGISPREAQLMDPQQRLLLELAWEAIEDASIPAASIAGSDCAVYLGISGLDYGMRLLDDLSVLGAHTMTGNTMSVAANRLSYVFDLRGPSVAIDTACSSSLVALHHACESLRQQQVGMALVGGVNLLLHPYPFVGFTKASMLSAQGRCQPFAQGADGYVRAEGAAVLLLKPLQQALRDRDRVHGVIRASGVNTDGARKSGLTIPSGRAQAELMRRVLGQAGLKPQDVDYLEAHGTGTPIGDPIEAEAISEAYARHREHALPIGSIKSNLGHLEPASGMAGLLKTLLVLKHGVVPPTLVRGPLNPDIDFDALRLQVVRDSAVLPATPTGRPLRAGVNSFGFGGVNAHVILEQAPPYAPPVVADAPGTSTGTSPQLIAAPPVASPLLLSAQDERALREVALRYAELLRQSSPAQIRELAQAAWLQRDWLAERLMLPDAAHPDAAQQLQVFAQQGTLAQGWLRERSLCATAPVEPNAPRAQVGWVFPGNGAQWVGMGRKLREQSAGFDATLRDVAQRILRCGGPDVLAALELDQPDALDDTALAQPALFALQVAAVEQLRACGLHADTAMGHSVGEIAASWSVGALSLDDACRVIVARSAAQATTRGGGRMAAVSQGAEALRQRIVELGLQHSVEVAADNAPGESTVSGDTDALQSLRAALRAEGVAWRDLALDYAFHSRSMDALREPLQHALQDLAPVECAGRMYSSVSAEPIDGSRLDASYWWRNVRDCVQFGPALRAMAKGGVRVFVEIGPHAILQRYIGDNLRAAGVDGRALALAPRREDNPERLREVVLRAALLGAAVDAAAWFPTPLRQRPALPHYPWQRQRHWYTPGVEAYRLIERNEVHPLLGARLHEHPAAWENHLDLATQPWLSGHRVGGAIVLPAAAYVEMALAASREHFGSDSHTLEGLDILSPVVFDGEHARSLRLLFDTQELRFRIEGRQRLADEPWTLHAQGRLLGSVPAGEPRQPAIETVPARTRIDGERHYAFCETLGLDYSGEFRAISAIDVGSSSLRAELVAPQARQEPEWLLAPPLLDQAFQSVLGWLAALQDGQERSNQLGYLPVAIGRLDLWPEQAQQPGESPRPVRELRARLLRSSPRSVLVDFELLDDRQQVVARLHECRFRAAALVAQDRAAAAWTTVTHLQALPQHDQPPSPDLAQLRQALAEKAPDPEVAESQQRYFEQAAPLLELLPLAFARDALREQLAGARTLDARGLQCWRNGHPLLRWLLQQLEQQGLLVARAGDVDEREFVDDAQLPSAEEIWRAALTSCPQAAPELLQVARAAAELPRLLAGQNAPPQAADPGSLLQAPAYTTGSQELLNALEALASCWPAGRRLRVLELCEADTPLFASARSRLRALPSDEPVELDWVVACANPDALARLQAQQDPGLRAVALEQDQPLLPLPADGEPAFDLVVLHHMLHRAEQPQRMLRGVAARMQPDAWLLLAERRPDHCAHLGFGIDPSWWHDADGAPQAALLDSAAWAAWLRELGWTDLLDPAQSGAEALAPSEAPSDELESAARLLGSFVLLARAPHQADAPGTAATDAKTAWALHLLQPEWHPWAQALAQTLQAQGCAVQLLDASAEPGSVALTQALGASAHVLFTGPAPRAVAQAPEDACGRVSPGSQELARQADALRQRLLALAAAPDSREVCVLLSGGALVDDHHVPDPDPAAAALWGLVRVAVNECQPMRLRLLDLGVSAIGSLAQWALQLTQELRHGVEDEVLLHLRDGPPLRRVPRLQSLALDEAQARSDDASSWQLDFRLPGQLRNLHWRAAPRRTPGPGEVEIAAVCAGLNFRDIMYAMGLLSDEAVEQGFAGASLGLEVAGRVLRCGPDVQHLHPGDEVLAFAGASFASHVVVPAHAVAHKPSHWSFAEAATVPTVFFTVWYALKHLARLQPGERVLVHGAAGGVGLAAMQVARLLGAEVYASAGSPAKREFLRLLGAAHVLDSRDPNFDREVLRASSGLGVDVVLNSLAGEAITRNLQCLKPFGRFIELGKRDFYENTRIGLRPMRNNLSYFGVDADQLMQLQPQLSGEIFGEVMQAFADGLLHPLPHRVFDADHVVDAFRHMQQARQIGKVVLDLRQAPRDIRASGTETPRLRLDPDATYLVTGGLGGFGLACARWLVERGARHLALLGRRGADTPGLADALQPMHAAGVNAQVYACDVTQREALAQVLQRLAQRQPPLRGIVHAAMVLDDGLLGGLDEQRLQRVLAPKLDGAWNLHELTRELPLDLFVLFSSATTLLGNPGQANYVAANAALEALARLRRNQGLVACAVAWGPIADVGVLTTNQAARDNLEARLGTAALASADALARLEQLLLRDLPGAAVLNLDANTLQRLLPSVSSPRFDALRSNGSAGAGSGDEVGGDEHALRERLASLSAEQARALVEQMLCHEVADILRLPVDKVLPRHAVFDLGMDSLMAVELGLALERRFGIRVPPMLLNENPTIERIAERLLAALGAGANDDAAPSDSSPGDATQQRVQALLAKHAEAAGELQADQLVEQLRQTAESGLRLID